MTKQKHYQNNLTYPKLTWQNLAHALEEYMDQISQFKTPKNIFVFP